MSEQGEEAPAESFATAKLRADVARQQMRLAKDQLKKARKRFKEARREARHARKLAAVARRVWKKSRRGGQADKPRNGEGGNGDAKLLAVEAASGAPQRSKRGRGSKPGPKRTIQRTRKPVRPKSRRQRGSRA